MSGDVFYSKVVLLAQFQGADGSTTFTDQSPSAHTLTAVGNAQILSNKLELDGTGDWVSSADHADWTLAGDFTIEVFGIEFDVSATQVICAHWTDSLNRGWDFIWVPGSTALGLTITSNGSTAQNIWPTWSPSLAPTAYNLAVVKSASTISIYANGSLLGSGTITGYTFDSTDSLGIGARNISSGTGTTELNGRMSAIRITNVARYSGSTYTVPSLPLPTSEPTGGGLMRNPSLAGAAQ